MMPNYARNTALTPYLRGNRGGKVRQALIAFLDVVPPTVSATAVHAAINQTAAIQTITTGITQPVVPCVLQIKGNVAGIAGNVVLTGKNTNGETITDTIALNGATAVDGVKAFLTLTSIALPIQTHVGVAQVETINVTAAATASATMTFTVTAAGMTGSPKAVSVPVVNLDTTAQVATKIRAALAADANVAAFFTIGGTTTDIILTARTMAADDGTMLMALTNANGTGVTCGASANTTAGVVPDSVSVGNSKKIGLYHYLPLPVMLFKLFNGADDAGTLATDVDEIEKNFYTVAGTPDSIKKLQLGYIV